MHLKAAIPVVFFLLSAMAGRATTLAPELKAYDFAEAYYIEDGGVVIAPYQHGFVCKGGITTPEGIRVMPGGAFIQYDPARMVVDEYTLVRLNAEGTRAFFHERSYRYKTEKEAGGTYRYVREEPLGSDDFYLSKWRTLEWFDFAFPEIEIHPGGEGWRTRTEHEYR